MTANQCPKCSAPLTVGNTGLDDEHCQECWETICSEGWWAFVAAAEEHMPELLGIEEE